MDGMLKQTKPWCHSEYYPPNKLLMSSASIGSCINDNTLPRLNQSQALIKQGLEEAVTVWRCYSLEPEPNTTALLCNEVVWR